MVKFVELYYSLDPDFFSSSNITTAETCVTVVNLLDVETALFGLLVIVSVIAVPETVAEL